MARDFRPKSARGGERKTAFNVEARKEAKKEVSKAKARRSQSSSDDNDDDDDEGLLEEIRAMGGDESDLALVRKGKGKAGEQEDDAREDVSAVV